jgi:hypothetical protein
MKALRQNEAAIKREPIDFIVLALSKFAWDRYIDLANLLFNFVCKIWWADKKCLVLRNDGKRRKCIWEFYILNKFYKGKWGLNLFILIDENQA